MIYNFLKFNINNNFVIKYEITIDDESTNYCFFSSHLIKFPKTPVFRSPHPEYFPKSHSPWSIIVAQKKISQSRKLTQPEGAQSFVPLRSDGVDPREAGDRVAAAGHRDGAQMRRLWQGLQVQVGVEAAQSESPRRRAELREASLSLRSLRQGAENGEGPGNSQSVAHRRKTVHLRGVRQVFRLRNAAQDSQRHPHWREEVLLRPMRQSFHAEVHVGRSQALSHRRTTVRLPPVWKRLRHQDCSQHPYEILSLTE